MKFKKHIEYDDKTNTTSIGVDAYYDNLPKGLTEKIVDKVHDYDSRYLAEALSYGYEHRAFDDHGYVDIKTPVSNASINYEEGKDTNVVLKTSYGSRSPLAKAIKQIRDDTKADTKKKSKKKSKVK